MSHFELESATALRSGPATALRSGLLGKRKVAPITVEELEANIKRRKLEKEQKTQEERERKAQKRMEREAKKQMRLEQAALNQGLADCKRQKQVRRQFKADLFIMSTSGSNLAKRVQNKRTWWRLKFGKTPAGTPCIMADFSRETASGASLTKTEYYRHTFEMYKNSKGETTQVAKALLPEKESRWTRVDCCNLAPPGSDLPICLAHQKKSRVLDASCSAGDCKSPVATHTEHQRHGYFGSDQFCVAHLDAHLKKLQLPHLAAPVPLVSKPAVLALIVAEPKPEPESVHLSLEPPGGYYSFDVPSDYCDESDLTLPDGLDFESELPTQSASVEKRLPYAVGMASEQIESLQLQQLWSSLMSM